MRLVVGYDFDLVRHVCQAPSGQCFLKPGFGISRYCGECRAHCHADRTTWIHSRGIWSQEGLADYGLVNLRQAHLRRGTRQAIATLATLTGVH
jgi:hypothetical protein